MKSQWNVVWIPTAISAPSSRKPQDKLHYNIATENKVPCPLIFVTITTIKPLVAICSPFCPFPISSFGNISQRKKIPSRLSKKGFHISDFQFNWNNYFNITFLPPAIYNPAGNEFISSLVALCFTSIPCRLYTSTVSELSAVTDSTPDRLSKYKKIYT